MSIETWMPALVDVVAGVNGINSDNVFGYDSLPGTLMAFPCAVIMPVSGTQMVSAGGPNTAHHRVQVSLFVSAQILPTAHGAAVPFIHEMLAAVAGDVTLNGLVQHCQPVDPPENWYEGPGELRYGDKIHVGINFYLDVKENETITITA